MASSGLGTPPWLLGRPVPGTYGRRLHVGGKSSNAKITVFICWGAVARRRLGRRSGLSQPCGHGAIGNLLGPVCPLHWLWPVRGGAALGPASIGYVIGLWVSLFDPSGSVAIGTSCFAPFGRCQRVTVLMGTGLPPMSFPVRFHCSSGPFPAGVWPITGVARFWPLNLINLNRIE